MTHIRWMTRMDMPEVLAIDQKRPHPWTEDDFIQCLRQKQCIDLVAEVGETVVGFAVYELHRTRLSILRLAAHPNHKGAGQDMLAKLKGKLSDQRTSIDVVVRESDLPAQLFYKAHGYRAIETLREEFLDTNEDGYLMQFGEPSWNFEDDADAPKEPGMEPIIPDDNQE